MKELSIYLGIKHVYLHRNICTQLCLCIQAIILLACHNKLFSWWEIKSQISPTYMSSFWEPLLLFPSPNFILSFFFASNSQVFFLIFIFTLFYFTILYWFWHTLTWIHHGCTGAPKHEPLSHLPPHIIPPAHPRAPVPSILHPASNIEWRFVSYMIVYMFRCHSPSVLMRWMKLEPIIQSEVS